MTKLTKREQKQMLRRERLKVLAKIDELNKTRCEFCSSDNGWTPSEKSNCNCEPSVEVRKLGIQLLKLVSERVVGKTEKSTTIIPKINIDYLTFETLTVEIYENMKLHGMTESDIMRHLKIGTAKFQGWKRDNKIKKLRVVKYESY